MWPVVHDAQCRRAVRFHQPDRPPAPMPQRPPDEQGPALPGTGPQANRPAADGDADSGGI